MEVNTYYKDYDDYAHGDDGEETVEFDTSVMEQYMNKTMNLGKSSGSHAQLLPPLTFSYLLKANEDIVKVLVDDISSDGDPNQQFQNYIAQHVEPSKNYDIALSQSIGRRGKMEDTVLVDCTSIPDTDVVAVFDGHNGKDAAIECTENYVKVFMQTSGSLEERLKATHQQLHEKIIKTSKSGTTSTVAFVHKDSIKIAFCGDSPGFVFKNDRIIKVTKDHKASNTEEAERITENGGVIFGMFGVKRVNGQIMVTRSIGDASLHPPLTVDPEIVSIDRKDVEWLLLVSDGITDVVTTKEMAEFVRTLNNPFSIAFEITKHAFVNESNDNLTTVVVKLN
ncbi:Protein phosphatase 1K [Entamoeba marina]